RSLGARTVRASDQGQAKSKEEGGSDEVHVFGPEAGCLSSGFDKIHLHFPLALRLLIPARSGEAIYNFTNLLTLSMRSFPITTW
ncbi:MAG: hypothetical protein KA817_12955, partial [Flavobacteriales bacterium]|nr:hypothetical protein [Flavobacteriales bacterium]